MSTGICVRTCMRVFSEVYMNERTCKAIYALVHKYISAYTHNLHVHTGRHPRTCIDTDCGDAV